MGKGEEGGKGGEEYALMALGDRPGRLPACRSAMASIGADDSTRDLRSKEGRERRMSKAGAFVLNTLMGPRFGVRSFGTLHSQRIEHGAVRSDDLSHDMRSRRTFLKDCSPKAQSHRGYLSPRLTTSTPTHPHLRRPR